MDLDNPKLWVMLALLGFIGLIWWQGELMEDERGGAARVIDGDSLEFSGEQVRLKGIDAPEGRQFCQRDGARWACGAAAAAALRKLIGGHHVTCRGGEFDRYGRLLAYCDVEGVEINRQMVRDGWALSYGGAYLGEEQAAKAAKRGLWSGSFERPADWRRQNNF